MANTKLRMLPLSQGKRVPVRLDDAAWQAIDWLAREQGQTWQEWCKGVAAVAAKDENLTARVREAAMSSLLAETVFADRGEQLAIMERHPLMRDSAVLNDKQLSDILLNSEVEGWSDFTAFKVGFGYDQHGQPCVWVRNELREGRHFAFLLPKAHVNRP